MNIDSSTFHSQSERANIDPRDSWAQDMMLGLIAEHVYEVRFGRKADEFAGPPSFDHPSDFNRLYKIMRVAFDFRPYVVPGTDRRVEPPVFQWREDEFIQASIEEAAERHGINAERPDGNYKTPTELLQEMLVAVSSIAEQPMGVAAQAVDGVVSQF